ncbi:MAG: hypothetical protein BACB_04448 [Bacteroides thetaiotaomicron]
MIDINNFKVEVSCEYKGEIYSVRDNGAIMRHPKKGCRIRPLDNKWTFGTKNENNGYMFFASNIRVHQVVASAFWGHKKSEGMVVDHKDTNRCNNRAENLHWVTKLENVLNNPITRRRIINICGSIAAFLDNPALLRESTADPNFTWMRTVSEEEAAKCKSNLERWSNEDADFVSTSQGKGIGEWIYKDFPSVNIRHDWSHLSTQMPSAYEEEEERALPLLVESLTSNAVQEDWRTPTEFPLCPTDILSLETYYSSLEKGKVFSSNTYGTNSIMEFAISDDRKRLCVATHNPEGFKQWYITYVYILNDKYIHKNGGSFFEENGALKTITLFQGKEWTGGDCIDDYC